MSPQPWGPSGAGVRGPAGCALLCLRFLLARPEQGGRGGEQPLGDRGPGWGWGGGRVPRGGDARAAGKPAPGKRGLRWPRGKFQEVARLPGGHRQSRGAGAGRRAGGI